MQNKKTKEANNKSALVILFVVLGVFGIFIFSQFGSKDKTKGVQESLATLSHSQYREDTQKQFRTKNDLPENFQNKKEKHVRKYPIYKITQQDYRLLQHDFTDLKKLRAAMKSIKSSHAKISPEESHFYQTAYWDLNKVPQNNQDYTKFIHENRIHILRKITEGISQEDIKQVQAHLAAMEVINFLSAFEFIGFDKEDVPVAILKEDVFALMQKNFLKKTIKTRNVAAETEATPSEAAQDVDLETEVRNFREEALSLLETSNPVFFSNYNDKSKIDKFYLEEDEVTDSLTNIFTTLAEYISSLEFLPEGIQVSETDTLGEMKNIFLDVKSHPDYYDAENVSLETIPDLPFSVYSKSINARRALTAALWAGSITIVGDVVSQFLVNIRLFTAAVLTVFPPESLLSGYHCFHGAKELYRTHLLHSELVKQKDFYESENRRAEFVRNAEDIATRASRAVESTHIDEIMRGQINQSWAWGFIMGYTRVGIYNSNRLVRGLIRSLRVHEVGKKGGELALTVMRNAQLGRAAQRASGGWAARNIDKILNLVAIDSSKLGFIGRLFDNPLFREASNLIKKAGPGLALTAADGLFSAAVSYQLVFNRLDIFSNFIGKIYLSPETSIALAVKDEKEGGNFFLMSLKYFAPVCNYFAHYEVADQSYTPSSAAAGQDAIFTALQEKRKRKCLQLLETFNVNNLSLRHTLENIESPETQLASERLYNAYYSDQPIQKTEASKALAVMTYAPSHYKVIWLSALRAIYPLKKIPQSFYTARNLVVHETSDLGGLDTLLSNLTQVNKSFEFAATRKNLSNMNYLLDYFAYLLCKEKNVEDLSACDDGENVDLAYAYEIIWEKSKERAETAQDEIAAYERSNRSRPWFIAIYKGIVEGVRTFWWSVKKSMASPAEADFEFQVPAYLEELRAQGS